MITKIRTAIADMRTLGANPDLVALNATDAAALDLLSDAGGYIFSTRRAGDASPLFDLKIVEMPGATPPYVIDTRMLGVLLPGTDKLCGRSVHRLPGKPLHPPGRDEGAVPCPEHPGRPSHRGRLIMAVDVSKRPIATTPKVATRESKLRAVAKAGGLDLVVQGSGWQLLDSATATQVEAHWADAQVGLTLDQIEAALRGA